MAGVIASIKHLIPVFSSEAAPCLYCILSARQSYASSQETNCKENAKEKPQTWGLSPGLSGTESQASHRLQAISSLRSATAADRS